MSVISRIPDESFFGLADVSSSSFTVFVDSIPVLVPEGSTVLEACQGAGIDIPRFCYHEYLPVAGNCRMCLVELSNSPKPVASCAMPATPNMVIYTNTPLVKKARENVVETLLVNHPLDCPICDQGGECDLQEQTKIFGGDSSRFFIAKRGVEDKNVGFFIQTIMTRCIHCTRCVRYCEDRMGSNSFGTLLRGGSTEIGTYVDTFLETGSVIVGNVIDLCPVGALTSRPYAFVARPWELRTYPCVDPFDSLGSNTYVECSEADVLRVLPRTNDTLNQSWISDKARFSYDSFFARKNTALSSFSGSSQSKVEVGKSFGWGEAFSIFFDVWKNKNTLVLVDPDLDVESLQLLSSCSIKKKIRVRTSSSLLIAPSTISYDSSIQNIESSDLCVFLGVNTRLECSVLDIRLRNLVSQGRSLFYGIGSFVPYQNFVSFLSLSAKNLIFSFRGKTSFQRWLSYSFGCSFFLGQAFLDFVDFLTLKKTFSGISSFCNFLRINNKPNNPGVTLANIRPVMSNDLKWAESIMAFCPDFNSFDASVLFNSFDGFKCIFSSVRNFKYSNFGQSAMHLPITSFLEYPAYFINSEFRPQFSPCLFAPIGESKSPVLVSSTFLYFLGGSTLSSETSSRGLSWIPILESSFLSFLKKDKKFLSLIQSVTFGFSSISQYPMKSNLEEYSLSNPFLQYSKNMRVASVIMRQSNDLLFS